jgi:hypothetical protein
MCAHQRWRDDEEGYQGTVTLQRQWRLGSAATMLRTRRGWGGGAGCVGDQARLIFGGERRGGVGKAVERWSSVEAATNGLEALGGGKIKGKRRWRGACSTRL